MGSVRSLLVVPTRDQRFCEEIIESIGVRAVSQGLSKAANTLVPREVSVGRFDRLVERDTLDQQRSAPHEAERTWYLVQGLGQGLAYNVVTPQLPEAPGMILCERQSTSHSQLSTLLSTECKVVEKARQQVNLTFTASFVNPDWKVSLGHLKANSMLRAVAIEIDYLPFSCLNPLPNVMALTEQMWQLLGIHDIEGVEICSQQNSSLYAQYGLSCVPYTSVETTPYKHYAVDLIALIEEMRKGVR